RRESRTSSITTADHGGNHRGKRHRRPECGSGGVGGSLRAYGAVSGGRRSTKITAVGVRNAPPWGAALPTTDGGTTTAVMAEPGTRAPAMGLLMVVPATPVGSFRVKNTF